MHTSLHYSKGGLGLGAACGAGATLVQGVLSTAAASDPEPISKAVLSVSSLIDAFFGHPDCSKIATTQIVNQAEVFMKQNLSAWQSLPTAQKTVSTQQAALANFDAIWAQVVQACSNPQYGTAGQNCIADRQRGGCHYQVNGECWNWFVGYRDVISNDPNVAATSVMASPTGNIVSTTAGGTDLTSVFLIGGAVLLFAMLTL
jgi:hypothetical protein